MTLSSSKMITGSTESCNTTVQTCSRVSDNTDISHLNLRNKAFHININIPTFSSDFNFRRGARLASTVLSSYDDLTSKQCVLRGRAKYNCMK